MRAPQAQALSHLFPKELCLLVSDFGLSARHFFRRPAAM